MKNLLVLAGLLATLFLYTYYADRSPPPDQAQAGPAQNQGKAVAAPDFDFTALNGKNYALDYFDGKGVVVNFWAPWCAPCVTEFPKMIKLAQVTKNSAMFLFISVDEDKTGIERFIKNYSKDPLPDNVFIGTDKDMRISQTLFQTYALPETYLISSKRIIVEKIIGDSVDWNGSEMKSKVLSLRETQ